MYVTVDLNSLTKACGSKAYNISYKLPPFEKKNEKKRTRVFFFQ